MPNIDVYISIASLLLMLDFTEAAKLFLFLIRSSIKEAHSWSSFGFVTDAAKLLLSVLLASSRESVSNISFQFDNDKDNAAEL